MFRTDHCYPPTVHAPLYPTVEDHHFEAIAMPAPLPPAVEPLAPSRWRTNNPPAEPPLPPPPVWSTNNPPVVLVGDEAEALLRLQRRARARLDADREVRRQHLEPKPLSPRWRLACAIGAAMFAVGYYVGRLLP